LDRLETADRTPELLAFPGIQHRKLQDALQCPGHRHRARKRTPQEQRLLVHTSIRQRDLFRRRTVEHNVVARLPGEVLSR